MQTQPCIAPLHTHTHTPSHVHINFCTHMYSPAYVPCAHTVIQASTQLCTLMHTQPSNIQILYEAFPWAFLSLSFSSASHPDL